MGLESLYQKENWTPGTSGKVSRVPKSSSPLPCICSPLPCICSPGRLPVLNSGPPPNRTPFSPTLSSRSPSARQHWRPRTNTPPRVRCWRSWARSLRLPVLPAPQRHNPTTRRMRKSCCCSSGSSRAGCAPRPSSWVS